MGPGTLFYRKDILDKAGVTEADLTKSWESFIAASKTMREKTGAYMLASAADIVNIYIRATIKPGEGLYFDKAGKPQLDTPRFKKAFELAAAARKADIDGKIAPWSSEWREAFRRGSLASQMMGAWLAGHLTDWLNPEAAGQWRAAPLPNGAFASWGGSFYAIPKVGKQKKEAWEFVKFMTTNKEMQTLAFRKMGAYPAIVEAQDKAFLNEPIAYLGGQPARLLWADAAAKIPRDETRPLRRHGPRDHDRRARRRARTRQAGRRGAQGRERPARAPHPALMYMIRNPAEWMRPGFPEKVSHAHNPDDG